MADYLEDAENAIVRGTPTDVPTMLALIDIAYSLRDITDELRRTRLGQHH